MEIASLWKTPEKIVKETLVEIRGIGSIPLKFKDYVDRLDVKYTLGTLQKSVQLVYSDHTSKNTVWGPCSDSTGIIFPDTQDIYTATVTSYTFKIRNNDIKLQVWYLHYR